MKLVAAFKQKGKTFSHFVQKIFELKMIWTGHVALFDHNKQTSLHNLLPFGSS